MTKRRYLPGPQFAFAATVFAVTIMAGCNQTQQTPAAAPPPPCEKVFVIFEGPWGFAPDPKDANFVIAMAPKTKEHRDLYVRASYNQTLASGIYDLSIPPRTAAPAGTIIPDIVHARIDPKDVQRVLDDKLERYAIRLPRPESYTPAARFRSSVGPKYPPDSSAMPPTPWATAVSLQYSVGSLSTFQLTGTPDGASFQPLPLQVDTPEISFVIAPAHDDDPADTCLTHARQAFHDLTKLLGVTLYVDFPSSPPSCHDKDPQKPGTAKVQLVLPSLLERLAAFTDSDTTGVQEAGVVPASLLSSLARGPARNVAQHVLAAIYFFAMPSGGCKTPIIVGGP